MSQQDSHCKWHQGPTQQQQHASDQHRSTAGKRLAAALRLKSQCELVNKVASIDIWATERLYDKWRREAVADQQSDRRHSTCQRRSGGERLKATLVKPIGAAGGGGHGDWPHRRRAHSRSEAAQLDDDQYPHQRRHHQHRRHHHRWLSLSNESAVPHSRHCRWAQQQSERTSDIDWPDSWPSIWGSSAPKCVQQQHTSSNSRDRFAGGGGGGKDAATVGCVACRAERPHGRRSDSRQGDPQRHCRARHSTVASLGTKIMTLEALVTLKSVESETDKRGSSNGGSDKHATACRLTSNSFRHRRSMSRLTNQRLLPSPTQRSKRRQSVDQDTYTIDGERTVAVQHLLSSHQRTSGQVEQRLKTVAWKNDEQPKLECLSSSQHDVSSSRSSSTMRIKEEPDAGRLSQAGSDAAVRKLDRTRVNSTRPTVNSTRRSHKASRDFTATSIACNNSVDGKSLQMLSTATSEREVDTETPTSATMCAAHITRVKPARLHSVAVCSLPEVMMQSNATMGQMTSSFDDLDDIIQTQVEVGESNGFEPKTGSVSRYVQDQVLMAAKLVATRGFAGLLGGRASEDGSDPNTTDTVGTVDEEDEGPEEDRDSLDELDDLEDDDAEEGKEDDARGRTEEGRESGSSRATTKARRPTTDRKARDSGGRNGARRQGGDGGRGASRSRRRTAASPARSKKLLPMTQCPTTQHRIECYRTQSGRVRCYMTARHPVKCHVEDGRIVCKATVNPETSHLPYPCNAAWH